MYLLIIFLNTHKRSAISLFTNPRAPDIWIQVPSQPRPQIVFSVPIVCFSTSILTVNSRVCRTMYFYSFISSNINNYLHLSYFYFSSSCNITYTISKYKCQITTNLRCKTTEFIFSVMDKRWKIQVLAGPLSLWKLWRKTLIASPHFLWF